MKKNSRVKIAYSLDDWNDMGVMTPIYINTTLGENSHMLISGMSGSGKSYCELQLLARLIKSDPEMKVYFSDYKGDDSFDCLRGCPRYYSYHNTLDALDIVYDILQKRIAGIDNSRSQITLIWDEYVANMLSLQSTDSKTAKKVMNQVSEILLLARSVGIRLICTCQRPDALVFPHGARGNYNFSLIFGTPLRSTLEMMLPSSEYIDAIGSRTFRKGEGILFMQSTSELHFVKIPTIKNMDEVKELCIKGLS